MNVLMYGWEFPPEISGGLGVACYNIVSELAKKCVTIDLVLPKVIENITANSKVSIIGCESVKIPQTMVFIQKFLEKINIHEIETLITPYLNEEIYADFLHNNEKEIQHKLTGNLASTILTGKYGKNLFSEVLRYALAGGEIAKNTSHDIIHAHDWLTGLAAVEAKKITKKPMIFQVHALEYDRSGENINHKIYEIEKYSMEQADCVVAVSQYTKNMIINRYHIPASKIKVVHNGIPQLKKSTSNHRKDYPHKMVLFVGRITHQKGPWYFIEIAKKVLSKRPDVEFVIAGGGDMLRDMVDRVAELRIGKNLHFTGFLNQDMLKKIYQMADVYVMPSVSEPFGLTCLEALSNNIPVVISKQSGVGEVLPHVLKADFWDINEMASKILALLDYRILREEMLKHYAEKMDVITWEKTAEKLLNIYNDHYGRVVG